MNLHRFEDLLDRFGPDLTHWPAAERRFARDLLARSAEAQAALDAAASVEAVLRAPAAPADAGLRRRILDIPLEHPREVQTPAAERLRRHLARAWAAWTAGAAGAAASLLLGFLIGQQGLVAPTADDPYDLIAEGGVTAEQEMVAMLDLVYELEQLP